MRDVYIKNTDNCCPLCESNSFVIVTHRFDSGRIVQCSDCGHIYLSPTLSDNQLDSIYKTYHVSNDDDSYMKTRDGWFNEPKGPYQYAIRMVEEKGGFSEKRIIDIGCGPGRFLHECRKRGAHVIGIDHSPQAAYLAKKYFNLDIICKPFRHIIRDNNLPHSAFDIVFAFEIIEHIQRPIEFLWALHELLIPGGLLFISTRNFYLFYLMGKSAPVVSQYSEHIHFFDPPSLIRCLEQCHFEIMNITTLDPLLYGDRKKQVLAKIPIVRSLWQKLRSVTSINFTKDMIFKALNKYREAADNRLWNGRALVCIARKPIG